MNCLHEKYEIILSFITKTLCLITLRKASGDFRIIFNFIYSS